jgi:succinyl-CoA synthetase beta subunit
LKNQEVGEICVAEPLYFGGFEMMLLEHHSKALLEGSGVPVPEGILVTSAGADTFFPAIVKAQVPAGGRSKAGGVVNAANAAELRAALSHLLAMQIKGHPVRAVRLERPVDFVRECYLSIAVDAGSGRIRVMIAPRGGVDVENPEMRDQIESRVVAADIAGVQFAVDDITAKFADDFRASMRHAGRALAGVFFQYDALLLEINPLFILRDGHWMAGDAKFVIDQNALPRQAAITAIIENNKTLYPEAALKLEQGFDFVVLDGCGDIGLVTTGAGLSMHLVDELIARGHRPFNFCDIRSGGFKGDPARLVQVFRWIAEGTSIRSVLMNFFAGMTDLGELAELLVIALERVPELKRIPITARMIGNGLDEARIVIASAGNPITIETDLEQAMDRATQNLTVVR